MRLDGLSVAITGAGRGIGRGFAMAAAALGAAVLVNDIDLDCAEAVVAEIGNAGGRAIADGADVADWAQAGALIDHCVEAFGTIDALVNNAAVISYGTIEEYEPEALRRTLDVNVVGLANCAAQAVRRMKPGATIVNVTSGAQGGFLMAGAYAASKGAVSSLTYTWAMELQDKGIRVNAISPSANTRMADQLAEYLKPRGLPEPPRQAPPEANAPLLCYLISPASEGLNGQVLRIREGEIYLYSHPLVLEPGFQALTADDVARVVDAELRRRQQPLGVAKGRMAEA